MARVMIACFAGLSAVKAVCIPAWMTPKHGVPAVAIVEVFAGNWTLRSGEPLHISKVLHQIKLHPFKYDQIRGELHLHRLSLARSDVSCLAGRRTVGCLFEVFFASAVSDLSDRRRQAVVLAVIVRLVPCTDESLSVSSPGFADVLLRAGGLSAPCGVSISSDTAD